MNLRAWGESILERFSSSNSQTPEGNAVVLACVRIGLGLILSWRCFFIARDAVYYFDTSKWFGIEANWTAIATWAYFALAVMLTLGVATRLVSLTLFLTIYPIGDATVTFNLGPQIMMPMFAGIFLLRGGEVWSVDAALRRWFSLDQALKLPGIRASQSVRLTLFLFCAVLHFAAVQFHLHDTHWLGGKTVEYMLTNSYLCRHYDFFRAWEATSPDTVHMLSTLSTLGQTVFQLTMIPLVFFRWGRIFVIVYGALFAAISLAFLQISMLPWVEIVLWVWLFLPSAWIPLGLLQTRAGQLPNASILPYSLATKVFVVAYPAAMVICIIHAVLQNHSDYKLPDRLVHYAVRRVGLMPPNVFNHVDLSIGDYWPMIYRHANGRKVLLPLNGSDGDRLRWHRSDLIYFGNSLRWRRAILEEDPLQFHRPEAQGHQLIARLLRYDFRRRGLGDDTTYEILIFESTGAKGSFGAVERHQPHLLLHYSVTVNHDNMRLQATAKRLARDF